MYPTPKRTLQANYTVRLLIHLQNYLSIWNNLPSPYLLFVRNNIFKYIPRKRVKCISQWASSTDAFSIHRGRDVETPRRNDNEQKLDILNRCILTCDWIWKRSLCMQFEIIESWNYPKYAFCSLCCLSFHCFDGRNLQLFKW